MTSSSSGRGQINGHSGGIHGDEYETERDEDDDELDLYNPKKVHVKARFVECFKEDVLEGRQLLMSQVNNLYRMRTGGQSLDYKSADYEKLHDFLVDIPGIVVSGSGNRMEVLLDEDKPDMFSFFCDQVSHASSQRIPFSQKPQPVPESFQWKVIEVFRQVGSREILATSFRDLWNAVFPAQRLKCREYGYRDIRGLLANISVVEKVGGKHNTLYVLKDSIDLQAGPHSHGSPSLDTGGRISQAKVKASPHTLQQQYTPPDQTLQRQYMPPEALMHSSWQPHAPPPLPRQLPVQSWNDGKVQGFDPRQGRAARQGDHAEDAVHADSARLIHHPAPGTLPAFARRQPAIIPTTGMDTSPSLGVRRIENMWAMQQRGSSINEASLGLSSVAAPGLGSVTSSDIGNVQFDRTGSELFGNMTDDSNWLSESFVNPSSQPGASATPLHLDSAVTTVPATGAVRCDAVCGPSGPTSSSSSGAAEFAELRAVAAAARSSANSAAPSSPARVPASPIPVIQEDAVLTISQEGVHQQSEQVDAAAAWKARRLQKRERADKKRQHLERLCHYTRRLHQF
jgi:hypothetical protein